MARLPKKTDNHIVAEWLIEHRWKESLNSGTKQKMPEFVEDAVMAAVYIVAGTSSTSGLVNLSPKLVFKCLMLDNISTQSVKRMEVGYDMSERHAQRLAQTVRFALSGIRHRIQEYESRISDEDRENTEVEKQFIKDYYSGVESSLYSPPTQPIPESILDLNTQRKYLEYAEAVQAFRTK